MIAAGLLLSTSIAITKAPPRTRKAASNLRGWGTI
jgi:hypothetical protein